MKAAREACRESYTVEGRPDMFNEDMVHYITDDQFAYAAAVNGIMQRDEPAACLYMGKFFANLTSYSIIIITIKVKTNIADLSSLKKFNESGITDNAKVSRTIPTIPNAYTVNLLFISV